MSKYFTWKNPFESKDFEDGEDNVFYLGTSITSVIIVCMVLECGIKVLCVWFNLSLGCRIQEIYYSLATYKN